MRYTHKYREGYGKLLSTDAIVEKLGQLEDIEEELGVSLAMFIKIFKASCSGQTVFVKHDSDGDYERTIYKVYLSNKYNGVLLSTIKGGALLTDYKLKDYGKTWALTKEELE